MVYGGRLSIITLTEVCLVLTEPINDIINHVNKAKSPIEYIYRFSIN